MTYAQMVAAFWGLVQLDQLQFTATGRVTEDDVDAYIMDGIYEMYRQIGPNTLLRHWFDVSLSAGATQVTLYDNAGIDGIQGQGAFWKWDEEPCTIAGVPIEILPLGQIDRLVAAGATTPYIYERGIKASYAYGQRSVLALGIYPPIAEACTLRLYYQRHPLEFSLMDDDTEVSGVAIEDMDYPDLPRQHHRIPIYWAGMQFAAKAIESQGQLPVQQWAQLFAAGVKNLRRDLSTVLQANQPKTTPLNLPAMDY